MKLALIRSLVLDPRYWRLVEVVAVSKDPLQDRQRHVAFEEEDRSTEAVDHHDGEAFARRSVCVHVDADHGVPALTVVA